MFNILSVFVYLLALCGLTAASVLPRSGKPAGGPAQMTVTIYGGPYTCPAPNSPPPTDGSAGTVLKTFTMAENTCFITQFPMAGAFTASLIVAPKTGTLACYAQIFGDSGCGLTLTNQYHGYPFDGVQVGSAVGCANPYGHSYGAAQIVCA